MDLTLAAKNDASLPQEQFKHYRLGQRLGLGGFGEVREAWDETLRRKVAIKRLQTDAALSRPGSLLHEARLAASLQHPAFVKIYAIEEDGAGHAILMELISGITLRELIARGPVELSTTLDLLAQAASAMRAAHACGLVHGDLKPSNLMLDDAGRLRILDLGLASYDDAQATTSVMQLDQQGTIAYMAPECLLGTAPNRLSDVYALGVVLYELLTGTRPFAALSGLALAAAQMQSSSDNWAFPASAPTAVVALVRAMTARRPEQRLAGMDDVRAALAACQGAAAAVAPAAATAAENATTVDTGAVPAPAPSIAPHTALASAAPATSSTSTSASASASASALAGPPATHLTARRKAWLGAALAVLLVAAGWLAADRLRSPAPTLSRAATMAQALQALESFDRPDRLEAARTGFTALLADSPDNAAAVAGMSLVASFRYAGNTQDETWLRRADAAAQQAMRLEPTLALSHVAHAWVLANQGQREQALAATERALALDPGNFLAALGKATFLTQLHRQDAARSWIEAMQRRHPRQRAFADALGTLDYEQGHYAAAEQAFRHSIALQPDSGTAYANLNAALLRQGRSEEAMQAIQQGLQVHPNANLYTNLGNDLFQRGDYVGAAGAFERAVTPPAGNPNSYLGWANLGDTLLWIPGREAQAQTAYRKARDLLATQLARAPDDPTLLSRMGLYAARSGDAAEAMALTAKALAAAPRSPDVHFRATLAYELLHHRELALAELSQARKYGYPAGAIDAEPDLVALRRDARYQPH